MMWFFAVLIVLAMGGVAVVAAGRGSPMAPVYDDRHDATVPADGVLSAQDLRRVRFSLAFRGYRMAEVDALLDRLAREKDDAELDEGVDQESDRHPDRHSDRRSDRHSDRHDEGGPSDAAGTGR